MAAARSGKSHVIAWAVAAFLGVPVLHLLSVPPVHLTNEHDPFTPHPLYKSEVLLRYGDIYFWVQRQRTPMSGPLRMYWDLWDAGFNRLNPGPVLLPP